MSVYINHDFFYHFPRPGIGHILLSFMQVGMIFWIYLSLSGRCCCCCVVLYTDRGGSCLCWWRGEGSNQGTQASGFIRLVRFLMNFIVSMIVHFFKICCF